VVLAAPLSIVEKAYRNVGYYLIALPLVVIAGFWIPYFSEIPTFGSSITTAVHIHALSHQGAPTFTQPLHHPANATLFPAKSAQEPAESPVLI
jgi:hypothetical protein